jgi:hypothetical protein
VREREVEEARGIRKKMGYDNGIRGAAKKRGSENEGVTHPQLLKGPKCGPK